MKQFVRNAWKLKLTCMNLLGGSCRIEMNFAIFLINDDDLTSYMIRKIFAVTAKLYI